MLNRKNFPLHHLSPFPLESSSSQKSQIPNTWRGCQDDMLSGKNMISMKSWSLSKNKRMKKNKSKKIDRHEGNERVSLSEIILGGYLYHIHRHQNNMSVGKRWSRERRKWYLVLCGATPSTTVAWYCHKIPRAMCQYSQKKGKV